MKNILEINQSQFEQEVIKADGLVIVDFSATWCGPCKRLAPELDAAAEQFVGKVKVVKVDVDESPDLATQYGVQGVPNMTFIKNGKVVDAAIGLMPRAAIATRIQQNL